MRRVERSALIALKLGAEVVEEQGADDFKDVLFRRVVRADLPAFLAVHHGLEERAEDGGGDGFPAEAAAGEQAVAHVGVELGEFETLGKEFAVDVGELAEFFVEVALALRGVGVRMRKSCSSRTPRSEPSSAVRSRINNSNAF